MFPRLPRGIARKNKSNPCLALCSCNGFDAEDLKALAEEHQQCRVTVWRTSRRLKPKEQGSEPLASGLAAGWREFSLLTTDGCRPVRLLSDAQGESDDRALSAGSCPGSSGRLREGSQSVATTWIGQPELMEETLAANVKRASQAEKVAQG